MGTFFVIPVYLQVVLGLDAFETGKRLLPLSVAMLVFALLGPRIAARRSPRTVAQLGLVAVSIGAIVMLATLDVKLNDTGFKVALALIGAGAGLLASQLGQRDHVLRRAHADQRGRRAPGHRPEPRVVARARRSSAPCCSRRSRRASASASADNPAVPPAARETIVANGRAGHRHRARRRPSRRRPWTAGSRRTRPSAVADDYGDAQLDALRLALGAVALAALLSLWFTRGLPTRPLGEGEVPVADRAAVAAVS